MKPLGETVRNPKNKLMEEKERYGERRIQT